MEMSQIDENIVKQELLNLKLKARELRNSLPRKAKKQTIAMSLSDEEFGKVISQLKNNKIGKESKVAFLLSYESGLRIAEVKNLQKENIDEKSKRIYVKEGKYLKDRTVPLPKSWKSWMMEFIPIKKSIRSLERNFKTACKKSELRTDLHYHNLRHSFATHCLERGMPINQVQLFLGHSNVQTTNVYIKANPIDALKSYEDKF